jgi:signal transduction histidine kinase
MAVPISGNPWAEAVLAEGGALSADAQHDPRLAVASDVIRHNGIVAMASAAYQHGGEVWGVCEVYSPAPLRLPADALAVLRGVAERVAAIVRATPRQTPDRAEAPATDPMTAAALHDLKSALAAQTLLIASFEKEIRAAASRPPAEPSRLGALLESLAVLRESVGHANELARVMTLGTMAPGARAQIDLRGVVRLALAAVAPDLRERFEVSVDEELAELGPVPDAPGLLRAVHNLVQNAALAVQRDDTARAFARVRPAGDDVLIEVEDEGAGVPAAIVDRLFEPGVTTLEHAQGHGYGLYSARRAVEAMGGTLALYSVPRRGARFTIRLPARAAGRIP